MRQKQIFHGSGDRVALVYRFHFPIAKSPTSIFLSLRNVDYDRTTRLDGTNFVLSSPDVALYSAGFSLVTTARQDK